MVTENRKLISYDILRYRRDYYIHKVKDPLRKGLIGITKKAVGNKFISTILLLWSVWSIVMSVNRYPEPTKENTKKKMTHVILDIFDEFFQLDTNPGRRPLYLAVKRVFATEAEHDANYSQRMTWFILRFVAAYLKGDWPPLQPWCPMDSWNDPIVTAELVKARKEFSSKLSVDGVPIQNIET